MNTKQEGPNSPYFNLQRKRKVAEDGLIMPDFIPGEHPLNPHRRLKKFGAVALGLSLILSIDSFAGWSEAQSTKQYVTSVVPNFNETRDDIAMNVTAGFGMRNSSDISLALSPFSKEGAVWATVLNNKSVDASRLADSLIDKSEKGGIKKLYLWGDSMGGTVSLDAAVDIQNSDADVYVSCIILENTPSNYDSIRSEQRENGQVLLATTGATPLSYSRIAQFVVGVGTKSGYYLGNNTKESIAGIPISLEKLYDTSVRVFDNMTNDSEKVPTAALMSDQFSVIVHSDVESNIMKLGAENKYGKPKPTLVLIRPTSDYSDPMVDSVKIENDYRAYALKAGLRLIIIKMPGIVHGDPTANRREYSEVIKFIIKQVDKTQDNPLTPAVTYEDGMNLDDELVMFFGDELVSY